MISASSASGGPGAYQLYPSVTALTGGSVYDFRYYHIETATNNLNKPLGTYTLNTD